ncbi:hypothetical protein ACFV2D_37325 [Streptomyces capillispiralis]|uniref:hypothetical protein n=1 Tax=Streptomyces capillispiralis TaxID=68182 RepID=UPI00368BE055
MVFTAASCLQTPDGQQASLSVFTPGREGEDAPFGVWNARRVFKQSGFNATNQTPGNRANNDFGIIALGTKNGKHIQDVVGAQGACFDCRNFDTSDNFQVFAYEREGEKPNRLNADCAPRTIFTDVVTGGPRFDCRDGRVLEKDADGSPLLAEVDPETGLGEVRGILNSRGFTEGPAMGGLFLATAQNEFFQQVDAAASR